MSILLAFSVALARPPAAPPAPADVVVRLDAEPVAVDAPSGKEREAPPESTDPATRELARRLAEMGEGRLDRVTVCRELTPKADRVTAPTLALLKDACPSWFPVPAPPSFCRIDPCVTDVPVDDGADRTAVGPR